MPHHFGSQMWTRLPFTLTWEQASAQFGRGPVVCSDGPGETTVRLFEKEIFLSDNKGEFKRGTSSGVIDGHTGWRLPSVKELVDLFAAIRSASSYPYETRELGKLGDRRFLSCNPKWKTHAANRITRVFNKSHPLDVVWAVYTEGHFFDVGSNQEEHVLLVR